MQRQWQTETDLAAMLLARGHEGRVARLAPETAIFVGAKLMTVGAKPTVEDVVKILCTSKCEHACYACKGKANLITRAYGFSLGSFATVDTAD